MKIVAYHRRELPEQRKRQAIIRSELAVVRRWAQGLEHLLRERDIAGATQQAAHIVRGLRTIERQCNVSMGTDSPVG